MRMIVIMLVLAGFAAPAAASGQPSRLNRHAGRNDAADVVTMWARCAATIEGNWAKELLATLPTTSAEKAVLDRRDGENSRCLYDLQLIMDGKRITFTPEVARGGIAVHLVRDAAKSGRTPLPGAGTAWLREQLARYPDGSGFNRTALVGHQFALCVADEFWPETRAFVLAKPDSRDENTALAALTPKLGDCMAPGATLNLNRPILRVLLSEAAYHALTYAPSSPEGAE